MAQEDCTLNLRSNRSDGRKALRSTVEHVWQDKIINRLKKGKSALKAISCQCMDSTWEDSVTGKKWRAMEFEVWVMRDG